jgi:hypothetical protein
MHTASMTSVVLPRNALGAIGLDTLDDLAGLRWSWLGDFDPPVARPRFILVSAPAESLHHLMTVCAAIARDKRRLLAHRHAAYAALQILRARLTRLGAWG